MVVVVIILFFDASWMQTKLLEVTNRHTPERSKRFNQMVGPESQCLNTESLLQHGVKMWWAPQIFATHSAKICDTYDTQQAIV